MTVSQDGTRGYIAARDLGLSIVDLSSIQLRELNPQVHEISHLTWDTLSIPQIAIPVTIGGHRFVVEIDEFSVGSGGGSFPAQNGSRVLTIALTGLVATAIYLSTNWSWKRASTVGVYR